MIVYQLEPKSKFRLMCEGYTELNISTGKHPIFP